MDIKVNDAEWNSLSRDEQARIEAIIAGFFKGARIVPDEGTARSVAAERWDASGNFLCEAACSVAQAVATAACAGLANPIAVAACVAAATAAGDACRKKC